MCSAAEAQHATKWIDAKRQNVRLCSFWCEHNFTFEKKVRINDVTPSWKSASKGKWNTQKDNDPCWSFLIFWGISKTEYKMDPTSFISTNFKSNFIFNEL